MTQQKNEEENMAENVVQSRDLRAFSLIIRTLYSGNKHYLQTC